LCIIEGEKATSISCVGIIFFDSYIDSQFIFQTLCYYSNSVTVAVLLIIVIGLLLL